MSRRIHVLHAVWNFDLGGLERVVAELSRALDPEVFETSVLSLAGHGAMAVNVPASVRLHRASPQGRLSLVNPVALSADIAGISPALVHTHSGVWFKAARAAHRAGIGAIVHTDHGRPHPDPLAARVLDGLAARYTDAVVAVSSPLAAYLRRRVVPASTEVRVIPNGVDTNVFRSGGAGAVRARLGIPADALVVGTVGRLEPVKAFDALVRAMAHVNAAQMKPAHLVLVGDGSQAGRLAAVAEQTGTRATVHLVGRQADIPTWLAAFDVFALSSLSEGTSMSLLEAMASECCPVVTAVGGNADVLGPGLAHRLVPPGDERALASSLADALTTSGARRCDAARARERVVSAYSLDAMVRAYQDVYRSVLGGTP